MDRMAERSGVITRTKDMWKTALAGGRGGGEGGGGQGT
jgi:hypothetical protein